MMKWLVDVGAFKLAESAATNLDWLKATLAETGDLTSVFISLYEHSNSFAGTSTVPKLTSGLYKSLSPICLSCVNSDWFD
jgi:hypothetical protein